jgi:hypothetical protein
LPFPLPFLPDIRQKIERLALESFFLDIAQNFYSSLIIGLEIYFYYRLLERKSPFIPKLAKAKKVNLKITKKFFVQSSSSSNL